MSFLDLAYQDVPELEILPEGSEVCVTVRSAKLVKKEETGNQFIQLKLADMTKPNVRQINENLFLPKPDDDEDKKQSKLRRIKHFCEAFQVDLNQCEVNDSTGEIPSLVNHQGWVILGVEEDSGFGPQNRVTRYVAQK